MKEHFELLAKKPEEKVEKKILLDVLKVDDITHADAAIKGVTLGIALGIMFERYKDFFHEGNEAFRKASRKRLIEKLIRPPMKLPGFENGLTEEEIEYLLTYFLENKADYEVFSKI